jgi:uncharacterized protein YecE (DUF72 family)
VTAVGRLFAGTSGFAYAGWTPRFYPPGLAAEGYLAHYASRLAACELNNTFYRRPSAALLQRWRDSTPEGFRFTVKAQAGGSRRALGPDPPAAVRWLTEDLGALGDRLGAVLFRVPETVERDDGRLAALLAAWPPAIPLVLELQHPSWHVDETFEALRSASAVLCATELDDRPPPDLRITGPFLYLRLRRQTYDQAWIEAWAARLAPFLAGGLDAFVFFRHDETGLAAERALALEAAVAARIAAEGRAPRSGREPRPG